MDDRQKPRKAKRLGKSLEKSAAPIPALVSDPDVDPARRDKIEKIKQALADGTYRISNDDVARKLIEHMREPKA